MFLQLRDLFAYYTSVCFYLSLTRSAQADTSPLAFQVCPHAGKPWEEILILGQLYLCAGMRGACPAGKDIKDEIGAVNDTAVELFLDVTHLTGRELVIKDGKSNFIFCNKRCDLPDLALIDEGARIGVFYPLQKIPDRIRSGCFRKECQLVKIITGCALTDLRSDYSD